MKSRCVSRLAPAVLIETFPLAFSPNWSKHSPYRQTNSGIFDIAVCPAAAVGVSGIIALLLAIVKLLPRRPDTGS
jgi:hypothetical protein